MLPRRFTSCLVRPASSTSRVVAVPRRRFHSSSSSSSGNRRLRINSNLVLGGGALVASLAWNRMEAEAAAPNYDQIREEIGEALDSNIEYDDGSFGPVIVRLAWHASGTYSTVDGTGGSNGATMRFAAEANDGANAGLAVARDLLEPIKRRHPGITYADLWTLAGAVAIEHMGGPKIAWSPGRVDKTAAACPPNGRLPDALQGASHVRDVFYRMGFTDREIVALAGAHALGRCHTTRSGFDGPWTRAPTTFSNEYFRLMLDEQWVPRVWAGPKQYVNVNGGDLMMLPADLAIRDDPAMRPWVELYARDQQAFFNDFSVAYARLLSLGCEPTFPHLSDGSCSRAPAAAAPPACGGCKKTCGGGFWNKVWGALNLPR